MFAEGGSFIGLGSALFFLARGVDLYENPEFVLQAFFLDQRLSTLFQSIRFLDRVYAAYAEQVWNGFG